MLTFSHFRIGSDKVLWLIILRNFFLRIRSFVDPTIKLSNYQRIKTTKMSYFEYYILSIFCTTLHYFYLFTRQALTQLLFYPLCISFEFIDFILIVGFLHSVKCLAKRWKYRITVKENIRHLLKTSFDSSTVICSDLYKVQS